MNRLARERSAYLRHAAHQKIDWYPWSDEAFEKAASENKPVFLSSGAVWCHWCHVMAQESFEDEETAALVNELFVSIKLDRDERPDVDRRFQQAVSAMGGGSGWPLSVFLLPDRKAFYGGTYFPPDSRQGRPSFRSVLRSVSDFFRTKRHEAEGFSERVMEVLKPEPLPEEELHEGLLDEAEGAMLALVDAANGGFGTAPKFPMPGALQFLLMRSHRTRNPALAETCRTMLAAMAKGGFHDHLAGGFHRYSVDEGWRVPHFEKMADDNAGLLRNYADACAILGDLRFREVAEDIIRFVREVLSDPAGGFYASQDADVTPDDEGGYFTWTDDEFRKILDHEEYPLLSSLLLHESGSMHHDPAKKVLFATESPEDLAKSLGLDTSFVIEVVIGGKKKLLSARARRDTPFIDRTLYTSLNGMMIAAFFHAYSVLGDENVKAFAETSLERILAERYRGGRLYHTEDVAAVLDDYVHLIDALVSGYEATAKKNYLVLADELMTACIARFSDAAEGGFFDTETEVLGTRMKRIEDVPHPSANAAAIQVLLKLAAMTGSDAYRKAAQRSLRRFAALAREIGVHAGAYYASLDAYFHRVKLAVEAKPESALAKAARSLCGKEYAAIVYGEDRGRVIPCQGSVCHEPISDPSLLGELGLNLAAGAAKR